MFFGVEFFKQIPHLQRLLQVVILYRQQVENTQNNPSQNPNFFPSFFVFKKDGRWCRLKSVQKAWKINLVHVNLLKCISPCENDCMVLILRFSFSQKHSPWQFDRVNLLQQK